MPEPRLVDPAILSAGSALLCSVLAQRLTPRGSELSSEVLGWVLLPVLFRTLRSGTLRRPGPSTRKATTAAAAAKTFTHLEPDPASSRLLWIIAASVATSCLCRADNNLGASLAALIPLLLIRENHNGTCSDVAPETSTSRSRSSLRLDTAWGPLLVMFFAVSALARWYIRASILSSLPAVFLLGVYAALFRREIMSHRLPPLSSLEDVLVPLASRVIAILCVFLLARLTLFGYLLADGMSTLLSGTVMAVSWYFVIQTTRYASLGVIGPIVTFALTSTRNPAVQSFEVQALSHLAASFLALGQTVHLLPRRARGRSALWILCLAPATPYLLNVLAIRAAHASMPIFSRPQEHPVEALMRRAKADFDARIQRQSQTYAEACGEYRRRYRVEPPAGFEAWYEFAKARGSPVVDEFDAIHEAVSPFWHLSGKQVLAAMEDAYAAPNNELWSCVFSFPASTDGHGRQTQCTHPHRSFDRHVGLLFDTLLANVSAGALPDVRFLVNHLDEPRVLITPLEGDADGQQHVTMKDLSRQPAWDAVTRYCAAPRPNQTEADATGSDAVDTFGLPFVTDLAAAMDLCRHTEYGSMHGLFVNPTSLRTIEGRVPVLSTGAPSTMGDVLMPSPAYIEDEFRYEGARDVEWDAKRNNLYWAGSTTGGFAQGGGQWRRFHRQRFVDLASGTSSLPYQYLRQKEDGTVGRVASSFLDGRQFDVAFTRIAQCDGRSCSEQAAHFDVRAWAPGDRALGSQLAFDTDGNGISGRFYKLLASNSAPLKQTLLREWHGDRLVPWVHYVPVSQGMGELPELVAYLTSTESGRRAARAIAEQGRDWFHRAFREADMAVYTYRLLLELARIQDPQREAI